MNQAIGNALLFNIIIAVVIILIAFFVGSLSYTKAFKVKNRIIEEIEKNQNYDGNAETEIQKWLKSGGPNGEGIGYKINANVKNTYCPAITPCPSGTSSCALKNQTSVYQYCVYEINTCGSTSNKYICGKYYRVVTFMYFDFPVIGDFIRIPVTGETMIFNEINS